LNSTLDLHFTTEPGRSSVLAHLPWELLHDENAFLIQRGILPVRRISFGSQARDTERKQPANLPLNVSFMTCSPRHVRPVLASKNSAKPCCPTIRLTSFTSPD